ncbi:MAG: PdxA family protein, partial [Phycisphaerae bacterium]
MGDPLGIGAEVVVKALADDSLRGRARFVVYGLHEQIAYAADQAELTPYWIRRPHETALEFERGVMIADFDEYSVDTCFRCKPTAEAGLASIGFLEAAMRHAREGLIDAIVTGPINKTAWRQAGIEFAGHTELLKEYFKARRVTMMFIGGPLRVALASIHEPLFELRHSFTIGRVFQPIDLLHQALEDGFGVRSPRIAVAGLNPHASENGRFGDEEERIIRPAIEMARHVEIDATGPYPADTLFRR